MSSQEKGKKREKLFALTLSEDEWERADLFDQLLAVSSRPISYLCI